MGFWSSETLRKRIPTEGLVDPYNPDQVKYAAYELRLGTEAFCSPQGVKRKYEVGEQFSIPPGQFGLLLTLEEVKIPADAIAFISIRSKYKSKGLINVSGFHVDPGFEGRLAFSVYNAGSGDVVLEVGERMFPIWYAALDEPTKNLRGQHPGENGRVGLYWFEVGDITGEVSSPAQLRKELDSLKIHVKILGAIVIAIFIATFVSGVNESKKPSI